MMPHMDQPIADHPATFRTYKTMRAYHLDPTIHTLTTTALLGKLSGMEATGHVLGLGA